MDLATAHKHIAASFERMRALYSKPVFDEWAILALGSQQSGVLAYAGPRAEEFRKNLNDDVGPLLEQVRGLQLEVGDFEFTNSGAGQNHDALVKLGSTSFLVCNNTAKSMVEIRGDSRWLKAQAAFVDLCEKFRAEPLEV